MVLIILAFLVSLVICITVSLNDDAFEDWDSDVWSYIIGFPILMSLLSFLIVSFFGMGLIVDVMICKGPYESQEPQRLYSLSNKTSVSGSFFLGSGSVHGEDYFYFLDRAPLGYYIRKVASNISFINECIEYPYYIISIPTYKYKWIKYLTPLPPLRSEVYQFYIPKNSIKYGFNVDINK